MRMRGTFMGRTAPINKRLGFVVGLIFVALGIGMSAHADEQAINRITAISVKEGAQKTEIIVSGSIPPTFSVIKPANLLPPRLFIDFSNAEFQDVVTSIEVDNGVVDMITIQQRTDAVVRIGRVIISLDLSLIHI